MPNLAKTEPVAALTGFQSVVIAAIVLLSAFDVWNPSELQRNAVLGFYAVASAWVGGLVRGAVTPTEKVGLTKDQIALLEAAKAER